MAPPVADQQSQGIPITSLPVAELQRLKEQVEAEFNHVGEAQLQLKRLMSHFSASASSIETLAESKEGQPLLLPITNSLYVNGRVTNNDKVLVDIGTGYYVEMTTDDGIAYCKRKFNKLGETLQATEKSLLEKKNALKHISMTLSMKMQQLQGQQQKGK